MFEYESWFWLGDGFLVLVMLTDQDNLYYSPVLLLWDVELFSTFHLVVNLEAHFCLNMSFPLVVNLGSHGISSGYYIWGVILAGRHFPGVSYVDRSR